MRRIAVVIIILAAAAVSVLYVSQQRTGPFFVSGFIEADQTRVGSRVGGRVAEVTAEEGQAVRAGDVLLRLEPFDLNERLAEAQASLAARKAVLGKLRSGFRTEEIAQARARRDRAAATLKKLETGLRPLEIRIKEDRHAVAKANLARAQTEFDRVLELREFAQAAQDEVDDATQALDAARAECDASRDELALAKQGARDEEIAEARADLAQAQASLDLLEKGFRTEDVAEAEANVRAAEAASDAIRRQIAELTVTAPADGVIEAVELEPGDLVAANAPVLTIIAPGDLWVRAYVPENRLHLKLFQQVRVRVDAFPDRLFTGRISYIARQAEFTPSNVQTPEERSKQVFRIKVRLEEGLDLLRAGMAADVFLEPRE